MQLIRALPLLALLIPTVAAAQDGVLCTVLTDANSAEILLQEGSCDQPMSPASTFKIAISLLGFDAGILTDEHSPALPFKEGYPDWGVNWKQTTDPAAWMSNSVLWYSQQVTQALGKERFADYVTAFDYGNADTSGDPGEDNALTRAWLTSSLEISPIEQLAFLRAIVNRQLPVSEHAYAMTGRITELTTLDSGWTIHGKTGSGYPRNADSRFDYAHGYGWFVGWASKGDRSIVFARQSQDSERQDTTAGVRSRDSLMAELPALLGAL